MDISQVDILTGSMCGPLSAAGGFCAGTRDVVEHQRITSAAYTYSCALPAMLAATAVETIGILQTNPEILTMCRENIVAMRAQLAKCEWVDATSSSQNPVQLFPLKKKAVDAQSLSIAEQDQLVQAMIDEVFLLAFMFQRAQLTCLSFQRTTSLSPVSRVCPLS